MSWDILLLSTKQQVNSVEEIDDTLLEPTDFDSILANYFPNIVEDDNHRSIEGNDFSIDYFTDEDKVSNKMLSLYGENGLYELVVPARKHSWQIFDTGSDQMIDLDNPARNGFEQFQNYLKQIKES